MTVKSQPAVDQGWVTLAFSECTNPFGEQVFQTLWNGSFSIVSGWVWYHDGLIDLGSLNCYSVVDPVSCIKHWYWSLERVPDVGDGWRRRGRMGTLRRGKFVKIGAAESDPSCVSGRRRLQKGFFGVGFNAEGRHWINVEFVEILRVIVYDWQWWCSLSFTSDWSFSSLSVDLNPDDANSTICEVWTVLMMAQSQNK